MRIAFIGTGRMGTELALRLLRTNPDMVAWNRTRERTKRVADAGATVADTAAEAVQGADVVVSSLFGPDTVREVIIDPHLIPDGVLWLDATTVSPADTTGFADAVATYVATPVVGTLGPAREGKLGVYVGTADDTRRRQATDLVKPWADPARLKPMNSPAEAAVGKLLANLALAVSAQGLKEALTLGAAYGIDDAEVLDMLKGTGLEFITTMKGPFVLGERDVTDADFAVDAIAKDARLMLDEVSDLPATRAALDSLREQQEQGHGSDDFSAILPRHDAESR